MTQEDLKQYYNLYTDCWKLFREYAEKLTDYTMEDDSYWKRLRDDCDIIDKRYGGTSFTRHLVLATECGIEDLAKSIGR